jgi:hypothetical protein
MTGNAVGVSLSPLPRFFAAEFLAEIFGVEPRSKNLLSVFRTLRTLLSFGVVGSAVTLRLLLSPSGLYRGPFAKDLSRPQFGYSGRPDCITQVWPTR